MPSKRRLKKGWDAKTIAFDPDTLAHLNFLRERNPGGFVLTHFVRRAVRVMAKKQGYKEEVIQEMTEKDYEEEI